MEKRTTERAKRRLRVRFGVDKIDRTAFTKNLSVHGLHLMTNHVFRPGTTIQIELHFPDRVFSLWARVVWAKKVPPQLAHVLECGMGVSFLDATPEWDEFFAEWDAGRSGGSRG